MAMRHPRAIILAGAFLALGVMSVLSAFLGHILPTLLPRRYTTVAAALLFFVFGAMMLREGLEMEAGNEKIQEELREVQKEVEDAEDKQSATTSTTRRLEDAEEAVPMSPLTRQPGHSITIDKSVPLPMQDVLSPRRAKQKTSPYTATVDSIRNLLQLFVHPILLQTFIMTFLAEWGDRSQISTIALAAADVSEVPVDDATWTQLYMYRTFGSYHWARWLAT